MLYNFLSLEMIPYISKLDISNTESMSYIFNGCSSLKEIDKDTSKWSTDIIKDISNIFINCNSLQKVPDISNWKIYKGNNAQYRNDNLKFIPQIEEEQKKVKEEEDKLKIMKLKILDNQKKLREQKKI